MAPIPMQKDEYELAMEKFETEFQFSNMDTMMHRFPPALRDEMKKNYLYMVEPRFVAIGPYHHDKKDLKKMEEVKNAAAYYLCGRIGVEREKAMQKVRAVLNERRAGEGDAGGASASSGRCKYYLDDETTVNMDATCFAAMMLRDACFLLLYMDVYERSYGEEEDYVVSDACFLLLYMDVYERSYGEEEDYVVKPSMRRFLFSNRDSIESDIMLLENQIPWQVIEAIVDLDKKVLSQAVEKFITDKTPAVTRKSPPAVTSISWMSAVNLEEIGFKLKVIPTATFSEMHLEKGLLLNRRLTLAPLSLSDRAASCLVVNMAALEVCTQSRFGDDGDKNAVCSYLAVLAFLMGGTKDVRKLRSMGLLHGTQSDGDMLAFFNAVAKHLPSGRNFAFLMGEIQEYKEKRPIRTTLYKWVYNHYVTIIKVVSLIATVIGLFAAFITLIYKVLSSVIHKN